MADQRPTLTLVQAGPYVTIELFHAITGYTVKAVERKIETGVWTEGGVWLKAPDGRRLISVEGYKRWVEGAMG